MILMIMYGTTERGTGQESEDMSWFMMEGATIETNTVEHVSAVSWSMGTKIIEGPYKVHTSKIAYTKFEYQRVTGEGNHGLLE
ncbi:hypothetical protein [Thermococcus piezophilus]|uniref:hypothetical protein n=1 Tax=Thermococcus piezophilus TaxID=1712654 RepID=UPI00190179D6|nr:hypothetical protein [Thermococcus piezophilus]